jgi:Kdo2-lipid IVA lauroyltransferase/acyltransferase
MPSSTPHQTEPKNSTLASIFRAFARLPLGLAQLIGACLGVCIGTFAGGYARRLKENAALAGFGGFAFRARAAAHAGMMAAELPYLWTRRDTASAVSRVQSVNWNLVHQARARGKGIVFLTPHLGCFEVTAQFYAQEGPITVLYREPKREDVRALVEHYRPREGLLTASASLTGVRALLRAIKRGEAVGLLPDQVPQAGEGVFAPFFGKPAWTMVLSAKLAQASGAQVLFALGKRKAFGRGYELVISEFNDELSADAVQAATQINRELERLIKLCPEQYLWGYNRYKAPK